MMERMKWAACLVLVLAVAAHGAPRIGAFPGAEGPGSDATGGRGGDVYHVTSLADDPDTPGTLRHGVRTVPPEGRTIVFDVGGIIRLQPPGRRGWLDVAASNLTIAGQTAPPPGITIIGQTAKLTGRNVILRNLRFRPGKDQARPGVATNDGISNYLRDSIIDHVSVSWADDEAISTTDAAANCTVQYCLMGEGLNYKGHAYGSLISSEVPDAKVSYHHNLYAHLRSRLPRLGTERGTGVILNFSNNIIYNWSGNAGYSANDVDSGKPLPSRSNFLGNYYIAGPSNRDGDRTFHGANVQTQLYQRGNLRDMNRNGAFDGVDPGWDLFSGTWTRAEKPFEVESGHVQPADQALEQVLRHAGATWWQRDEVDQRIVQSVREQAGRIINEIDDVGGWPKHRPTSRPADFDTDGDGMPDEWEKEHGLDPTRPDHNGDFDGDGYTNLEEYLNDIAAFPAPKALRFTAASGRYEDAVNWELRWTPSRHDTVLIDEAVATVNSPGQHAGTLRVGDRGTLVLAGGWLRVQSDLILDGGTVVVRIAPASRPTMITVGGQLKLGGVLRVELADGFRPAAGERIEIISAAKITSRFAAVLGPYGMEQDGGKVVLVARPAESPAADP